MSKTNQQPVFGSFEAYSEHQRRQLALARAHAIEQVNAAFARAAAASRNRAGACRERLSRTDQPLTGASTWQAPNPHQHAYLEQVLQRPRCRRRRLPPGEPGLGKRTPPPPRPAAR